MILNFFSLLILVVHILSLKNPSDATLASLSISIYPRWRPRWRTIIREKIVFMSFMSVRVVSHQQICFNQLQLTCNHICSCGPEPAGIYVTLASDHQFCPYDITETASSYMHSCIVHLHPAISHGSDHLSCLSQLHLTSSHVC